MSKLYLACDPLTLVDRLAEDLDSASDTGDFFAPTRIVVPNRHLKKWLRLQLARRLDIAINLEFHLLEDALWLLLRETDSATATPPEPIDDNAYRLMVLAILLDTANPHLAPLRRYGQLEDPALSRLACRRAWFLADKLGVFIRNYEYDRQDILIQPWLAQRAAFSNAKGFAQAMEAAQRTLFQNITREPDGRRALLNQFGERNGKTLPQYAMERMTSPVKPATGERGVVHFFGLTQVGDLHLRAIAWLSQLFDVRYHFVSALASRLDESRDFSDAVAELRERIQQTARTDPGRSLLGAWARAEAESLTLLAPRFSDAGFQIEYLREKAASKRGRNSESVLNRLRDHLVGVKASRGKLPQDRSLQILGCPGVMREVETVYESIVANMRADPALRQTDIAVLVTDMSRYRPALSAVFERPPRVIQYNMSDFNAAEVSTFGQAVLDMLELALESFTRSRVFKVLLNPCFLTRLGVDRSQANVWLEWAEQLGIYQGWDEEEKRRLGYPASPFYAWKLGLQRLRLGRYMDVAPENADEPAPRFGHIVPYADIHSTEREELDLFCRAVESLLPSLARLRTMKAGGTQWAAALTSLIRDSLDVPNDRPEEAQVRENLLPAIASLEQWDALNGKTAGRNDIPLALVREFVQAQLASIEGSRGEFLTGGVTISALQPMRPIPAAIVYILGLNEDCFPGSNALSAFDLRGVERIAGDVRPAEQRLQDFLTAILSSRSKLYLSYNRYDGQRDQALQPAVPLVQLQQYLFDNVIDEAFQVVDVPSMIDDPRQFDSSAQPPYQDVLGLTREAERCAVLAQAESERRLTLDETQAKELAEHRGIIEPTFVVPAPEKTPESKPIVVSLVELKRFLQLPAAESLRRHLHIRESRTRETDDDEPVVTADQTERALIRSTLQFVVESAATGPIEDALKAWPARFHQAHAEAHLRCQAPEQAFGEIDRSAIMSKLRERIQGQGALETFLRERTPGSFCGPVLLGESITPVGARLRFPALVLRIPSVTGEAERTIRLVGSSPLAWQTPGRFDILVLTTSSKLDGRKIDVTMIEPTLLYLALLANTESTGDGTPTNAWMLRRDFFVHVAHGSGVQTWQHAHGSITSAEALQYLVELTRDLLDPAQFDLLPLQALFGTPELERGFDAGSALKIDPNEYRQLLIDKLEDARENEYTKAPIPDIVEMIGATVPTDALAKVQRRLRMLDRGPAGVRKTPTRGKRTAKP